MTKRETIIIICGLLLIATVIILFTLLGKRKDDDAYKELIKAHDETIQAIIRERDVYRQWKDDVVDELQKMDSILQTRVKTNIIRYEKIPVTVSNLSDDELRSAVENYR